MDDVAFFALAILQANIALDAQHVNAGIAKETTMKKPSRLMNRVRFLGLGLAALALSLPATNLQQSVAAAVQADSQVKLPAGISMASAHTSWQTVFASRY
mgnify:FL=1